MRTWMADLLGLIIGFALGGAVLAHFWPELQQARLANFALLQPAPQPPPAALPQVQTPSPQPPRQIALAPPRPAPLPDIINYIPSPAPLPHVTDPDQPEQDVPPPNTLVSGTGFFVAEHLVMTAAHVVPACRGAGIISPQIKLTPADVIGRDTTNDIALLRVDNTAAPAVLAIGRPAAGDQDVVMLGYPSSAGLVDPETTSGRLENDKLSEVPNWDPRRHVLMEASVVRPGYSGGAIFDPHTGKVIGIVRATLFSHALQMVADMPSSGLATGPGSALLTAFLQDEAPGTDAFPADQWGDDPLAMLRRATVHVLCWH